MKTKKHDSESLVAQFDAEKIDALQEQKNFRKVRKEILEKHGKMIFGETQAGLNNRLEIICDHFLPLYVRADILSGEYQAKYRTASKLIYLLADFAIICVAGQYIFHLPHVILFFEILAISSILCLIFWGNRMALHQRWLDYRMMAERLRCAIFTTFVRDDVAEVEKKSLHCSWLKTSWVLSYLNQLWQTYPKQGCIGSDALEETRAFIKEAWLGDQIRFHIKKSKREAKKHHYISLVGEICFFLTLVAAILHFLHIGNLFTGKIWTFLAIVFPATGSALAGLRAHLEYKNMSQRSEMMVKCLYYLETRLNQAETIEEIESVVSLAENLMLEENAEWHIALKVHELEPPG